MLEWVLYAPLVYPFPTILIMPHLSHFLAPILHWLMNLLWNHNFCKIDFCFYIALSANRIDVATHRCSGKWMHLILEIINSGKLPGTWPVAFTLHSFGDICLSFCLS